MLVAQLNKSNKVGVVLIARQTSARLPNKVLMEIKGKKLIEIILEKVLVNTRDYIFAIPENQENLILRNFLEDKGYPFFTGSENDVLRRFIGASELLNSKFIQRLNCDNLLFNPSYMKHCYNSLDDSSDVYTNVNDSNHSGSSVEIIRKENVLLLESRPILNQNMFFHIFILIKIFQYIDLKALRKKFFQSILLEIFRKL